mmetsp:Transcript_10801/g.13444  ORF Transcript_10801/g.13444 Transcript_10801/m.13444 type:complete len:215 (+) Transcript_10801:48-692(+)
MSFCWSVSKNFLLIYISCVFGELLDLEPLRSDPCYEPFPLAISRCSRSCPIKNNKDISYSMELIEADYDEYRKKTIFTYDFIIKNESQFCINERNNNDWINKPINGIHIIYDGCCHSPKIKEFTFAFTPHNIQYLKGGWSWNNLIQPNIVNPYGLMIKGKANITTGIYCIQAHQYCVCDKIAVPDICNIEWKPYMVNDWFTELDSDDAYYASYH